MTYLPNLLTARGGTIVEAGQLVTAFLLVGIIGMYLGGYLADRFGPIAVSVVALVVAVPCLLGFFFAPPGGRNRAAVDRQHLPDGPERLRRRGSMQSLLPRSLGMALGLINDRGVAFGAGSVLVTVVGIGVTRYGPEAALMDVSAMPLLAAAAYLVVAKRLTPAQLRPATGGT